jgi:DNA-binding LacI/PurR family transcriptional regulator
MEDVARAAGVSERRYRLFEQPPNANIPDVTRQRILKAARELDYIPNIQGLNLATGKTMMIALIVRQKSEQMSADAFLVEVIQGVVRAIETQNYHLLVHAVEPDAPTDSTYRQLVRAQKVDGLLITSPMVEDLEVQMLVNEGTPLVLHGAADDSDIPSVDVDNLQEHTLPLCIIGLGHRRIGHISNALPVHFQPRPVTGLPEGAG